MVFLQAQTHLPLAFTVGFLVRAAHFELEPQLFQRLERLQLIEQLEEKLDEEPVRLLPRQLLL